MTAAETIPATPRGGLDLPYLHGYWKRTLAPGSEEPSPDLDFALLSGLHLGLLETLQFLHCNRPSFAEFEAWIQDANDGSIEFDRLDRLRRALLGEPVGPEVPLDCDPALSPQELAHFDEEGYVIVRGAVSAEAAQAAAVAIYDFLDKNPADPDTWYGGRQPHSIWVPLLRHPAFQANRRSPRLVKAFAQLWRRDDLWSTVDQGGFNPPERPGWAFPGPHLHWDTTLAEPHHFGVQGILYLADCAADQGAFTCVPGFHRKLKTWLAALPDGADPRQAVLGHPHATPIAARAGDLIIWNHLLPHGSSPNSSSRPRVAQYISLKPTRWEHTAAWL